MKDLSKSSRILSDEEVVAKHFARLLRLLREEEKQEASRFNEETAQGDSNLEKRGHALLRLVLNDSHFEPSGQKILTFSYADGSALPRYTLNAGDPVDLSGSEEGHELLPEQRPHGTVYERDRRSISVAFSPKLSSWVGRDRYYHLRASKNKTTHERLFAAIREVGHVGHARLAALRNISLGLKDALELDPVPLHKVDFQDLDLNLEQRVAVAKALEAQDFFLLHGPPGTGKTRVLIEMIRQARLRGATVLVSAPSNAACDNLVEALASRDVSLIRLGHPARMNEDVREHTLSYRLNKHPMAKLLDEDQNQIDLLYRQKDRKQDRKNLDRSENREYLEQIHQLKDDIRTLRSQIFKQVWGSADIVVATHTGCADPLVQRREFDWVVLDEAAQAIEPASWIPIMRGKKVILAGDHCQLPPTVLSSHKGADSLEATLFARMEKILPDHFKARLEEQYRGNQRIMDFSSAQFYEGKLRANEKVTNLNLTEFLNKEIEYDVRPFVFVDTAGQGWEEAEAVGSKSKYNEKEATLLIKEYRKCLRAGLNPDQIAIISPYGAQVKYIYQQISTDDELAKQGLPEIDSVDAFQGREKEIVLLSLVRSNLTGDIGFLADTRRMNVALTRAKRKCWVIGDSATIAQLPFYEALVQHAEQTGGYQSTWG